MIPTAPEESGTETGPATGTSPGTGGVRRGPGHAPGRFTRGFPWLVAGVAALLASTSPAAPTGISAVDWAWSAVFAAAVTLAASRSRRWAWLWLAGVASATSVGGPWFGAGLVALGLALLGVFQDRRNRSLGSLVGATAALSLLNTPAEIEPFGLATVLTAVAVLPTLWSAWDRSSRRDRRRLRDAGLAVLALSALVLVGLAVAALTARVELGRGVDSARAGLEAVREGDQPAAAERFSDAAGAFERADDALRAPWALPARLLPGVAPQVSALTAVAASGESLSTAAGTTATAAPYDELTAAGGTVDLTLVRAMQAPVDRSVSALRLARDDLAAADSPWLVPQIAGPMQELATEIDDTLPDAELAADGLRVAPGLLGGEGERTYVVLFTNPAESRFLGGFVGAYGILEARDGRVRLTESGGVRDLRDEQRVPDLEFDEASFPELSVRFGRYDPARFFQNLTVSPDFPTTAALTADLVSRVRGTPVDGVVVADPYGLAALLSLTGPITVDQPDGTTVELTSDNAAEYLLLEQYLAFEGADDERIDALAATASATFDALTARDLPGPRALGEALGPALREGRLMFTSFEPDEVAFLTRTGVRSAFDPAPGADYLSVRSANAFSNKIDTFLDRSVEHEVLYDPATGVVESTVAVRFNNRAPAGGLPRYVIGNDDGAPPGTTQQYVSIYTPLEAVEATLDGEPTGVEPQREFGGNTYSVLLRIPPGGEAVLRLRLRGVLPTLGAEYRLDLLAQPTANPDQLSVRVSAAPGPWETPGGAPVVRSGPFTEDGNVSVGFVVP